ncbi:MAG: DUF6753 family protein [Cyanobacteria bacterium P01_F01_bin.86]
MANRDPEQTPLDALLEGRSAAFKGKVLTLVRQYKLDETDPTFLLLAGTHSVEVMLEKYPKEFEEVFMQLLKTMEGRWMALKEEWATAAKESTLAANNLAQAVTLFKVGAEVQHGNILKQGEEQGALLSKVYEEQRENLAKETERLIAQGTAIAHKQAAEQFEKNVKAMRWRHYAEAGAISCLSAALLLFSGWFYGWHSRGTQESGTYWSQVQRWNAVALQACVEAEQDSCKIQIKPLEAKQKE